MEKLKENYEEKVGIEKRKMENKRNLLPEEKNT
jgi:hypothetical protein